MRTRRLESGKRWMVFCLMLGCGAWAFFDGPRLSAHRNGDGIRTITNPGANHRAGQPFDGGRPAAVVESVARLGLRFEVNKGQTDGAVGFLARGPGYNVFLTATEAVLALR